MPADNAAIADLLRRYAAALALEGADRFKTKAYRRAADTVEALDREIRELIAEGEDLTELPGVGKAISGVIHEIVEQGALSRLDKSLSQLQPELVEVSTRPLLNAKTVLRIYKKLGINSLAELRKRLETGDIGRTFGARTEYQVRLGLDERPRILLWDAKELAARIEKYLAALPQTARVSPAGSFRRRQDTVGDLNFLIAGKSAAAAFKAFAGFSGVHSSERRGPNETVFRHSSGINISLVWTKPDQWGLALILATGSPAHLEDMRQQAKKKRLTLSPASLAKGKVDLGEEAHVYKKLGLRFIEPELREGRGEVAAAAKGALPQLVRVEDLRGDLHMHTTASDGRHTIAEMVAAARERGFEYIAISDHSQSLKITNGLTERRLLAQCRAIDKLNDRLKGFVVLKSAEVDILEDGRLDYSDEALKALDFSVCSIHSKFSLSKQQQTDRLLRAMDNPYFNILGHATGRLLLKREGYQIDLERVLDHAAARGCLVEINSSPDRLDLSDEHAKLAKERGIKIAVNTDAHSIRELDFITAGINQARRAWLTADDVLNTLPLAKLRKALKR